jgi:putative ABC transport system permease protein
MSIFDSLRTGLMELLSHKMRSSLTMMGVIFGVAAVIAMVSIGEGAKQETLEQIREMGTDTIVVKRISIAGELLEKAQKRSPNGLRYSDAESIRAICSDALEIVPVRQVSADVKLRTRPMPVKVVGVGEGYDRVLRLRLQNGRFLSQEDVTLKRAVCVLGSRAKRDLAGFTDPIGQIIHIDKKPFRVVGYLETMLYGESPAFAALRDTNSDVYIPITVSISDYQIYAEQAIPLTQSALSELWRKLNVHTSAENSPISEIVVRAPNEEATAPLSDVIHSIIERHHRGINDFAIIIPAELIRKSQQTQQIFNIVMLAIASISLLVGGIGIMNIMLATVSQRTREIAIRRCVGATRSDVVRQFLLEALVITCIGGLIGVGLGVGGARGIALYAGWVTVVSAQAIIISFSVSALVGIVFGLYPAVRAAMVDPSEALRQA